MTDLEILMMDGCTKREALRFLDNGTWITDDIDGYVSELVMESIIEADEAEDFREGLLAGKAPDHSIVSCGSETYLIVYEL